MKEWEQEHRLRLLVVRGLIEFYSHVSSFASVNIQFVTIPCIEQVKTSYTAQHI
jgi:hypothetical protein